MFNSVQTRNRSAASAVAVDIAPLIDVVFILLIFFLVTATFIQDTGVRVRRPQSVASERLEPTALRVSITATGAVYFQGRQTDLPRFQAQVRQAVARSADVPVVVVPDERVPAGRLVAVMDSARTAGARDVAIATRRRASP